ncbi:hypothetical protein PRIPAC_74833 [Pristionchus pacificus]|uniref:Biogenesis of lysosome-related organelles complex 1 subunit 7 n=1 Tax=Pristionchus pacificus TaxID=54126 RepID=A0A2A6BGM8_PRIPA|nr:hypothetical protein PRIPAC_74833 [Pristionchus pacificus]|eukprot:PDM65030.1 hypothetical protein PRIPAC_53286 [Pristionchus pacificus]
MSISGADSDDVVGGGAELADSIMAVLGPAISALDKQVLLTRHSQTALGARIEEVSTLIASLPSDTPCEVDDVVRKLDDCQRRVDSSSSRLVALVDRLGRLQREIAREKHAHTKDLTAPPPAPPKR